MGIIAGIERAALRPGEGRSFTETGLTWDDLMDRGVFGTTKTRAGPVINETTALNLSPVFAAVRRLSEDVAKTPRGVFKRLDRGRERQHEHATDRLISLRPNPEMSAFTFFEIMQGHLATWGNAYAEIERDNAGRAVALWPITPDRVRIERANGKKIYWIRVDGTEIALSADLVFHVPGFGYDGMKGYSVITLARQSLGLTAATESYGSDHFGRGARPPGVLMSDKKFADKGDKERMRHDWERMHSGLDNAHRIAILEQGVTYQQIGIAPEDSQFLETRKFQVTEVARWFLMPPHKLGDLTHATFSNIEHQGIEYVQDTLLSWYTRWEQALGWDLFSMEERASLYVRFNANILLRGDSTARSAFYQQMFGTGSFSPNDIRELEELNPVDGGDTRFVPMNFVPLDEASDPPPPPPSDDGEAGSDEDERATERRSARELRSVARRRALRGRHEALFRREAQAIVKRETDGVRAAVKKAFGGRDSARLRQLIDEFYDGHEEWVKDRFMAPLLVYAESVAANTLEETGAEEGIPRDLAAFVARYALALGRRWTGSSVGQMGKLIRETDEAQLEAAIEQRLGEWTDTRPDKVAMREVVEAGEAVTKLVYAAVGVTVLRWSASGESCPLCSEMDGRTVGVEGYFMREGDTLDPGDPDTAPLKTQSKISHPPLHAGCDCSIIPG